jgi:rare lipoprotein A
MIRTLIAATLPAVLIVGAAALFLWAMPVQAAECGGASWYGPGFHGKKTASGSTYNQNAMTAAHRTLPFGTVVKVTDQRTGKSIRVTITDRGPFIRGRVIDLSKAAAAKLGTKQAGVARVCLSR